MQGQWRTDESTGKKHAEGAWIVLRYDKLDWVETLFGHVWKKPLKAKHVLPVEVKNETAGFIENQIGSWVKKSKPLLLQFSSLIQLIGLLKVSVTPSGLGDGGH